uniref:Uncharacterized protein n=1 Tax=Arundo donax TaxID=35708 RepID=A0A0A9RCM9_ARUDO
MICMIDLYVTSPLQGRVPKKEPYMTAISSSRVLHCIRSAPVQLQNSTQFASVSGQVCLY